VNIVLALPPTYCAALVNGKLTRTELAYLLLVISMGELLFKALSCGVILDFAIY
jgi:hypothetical protein